ncbi:hypothetical protein RND71_019733 [Anisodus tanguticus]|uniref:Uncharacterized protein n=1 Tax=Anisodus tanguticus TaxID=243964 RepID=A0AAE1RZN5_9SOLA|nr:hypothetical protein RND71_019733 [Anisodus tanguticus]
MRAFHLAWFSLFSCFFSTFAIPPLLEVNRCVVGLSNGFAAGWANVGSGMTQLAMPLYSLSLLVLVYGQDLPDGNYKRKITYNQSENLCNVLFNGLKNYRGWILGLTYGFCLGAIAASFGLANCVSRPIGGIISDKMGKRFGMRGRLWSLWAVQTVAGLMCAVLGRVKTIGVSVLVMACFTLFVQAASASLLACLLSPTGKLICHV